ncbi:MAG: PglZ domain-containing protein [Mesorhizobium sp.]|uniref:PglZ domain-containing protein n=1 Tax=Mesorhizobium sp. TaxID=1871066 RepID=UPI000FE8E27A|nr:PglZ domain-containing protein [Mesorhizobium sp.]RWO43574.1 MAG: PglZ domain-containing protein [Mesorhizobium sp.]RWP15973.1 MAG: PglZ domain-containing protein [Mesorhizobium sp.]
MIGKTVHPLHVFIATQIAQHLKSNTVVVLYDRNGDLKPFFRETGADPSVGGRLDKVRFGEVPANFTAFAGSFLETRLAIEDVTGGGDPERTLIYVPGTVWDEQGSLLMEVEKAGYVYRPVLKQMARIVLKKRFNDVQIDEILKSDAVGYDDLAKVASASADGENASILRGIFDNTSDTIAIIARWTHSDHSDQAIQNKGAMPELRKLLAVRLGLTLPDDASLPRLRSVAQRHVLGSEFLLDTKSATLTLPGVSAPTTRDQIDAVRVVAERLRRDNAAGYEDIANLVQGELGIDDLGIEGDAFGSIDTFKIEEFLVVGHCFKLIAARRFADARAIIDERQGSFWIERSHERSAVWQACRLMTDLGLVASEVQSTIAKANGTVNIWVDRYTDANGWHRLDRAQRELETVVQSCEEHIDEQALGIVRQVYEETAARMAEGFVKALAKADWAVSGATPQSRVYAESVAGSPKPVAYILVDAMRYEMGVELSARIAKVATEQKLRYAVASLPSITPVCMAALQPGAAASFSVVDRNGKLGAEVDGTFLPDLKARQLFAKGRLPGSIDLTLDNVLQGTTKVLAGKIAGASVILVRSQEIDEAGEGATSFARRMMAGVIEDLARCLTKLAGAGVEHAVIVADHGHLFFAHDRDESMRIDAPGGAQVDLHRRCWVGRGGATPPGTVRVPASKLGYQSDLDFVLPVGTGVFRAGGDLAYHHGGASLQELIVPVLTVRLKADKSGTNAKNQVEVQHEAAITNRIFTVRVSLGTSLFSAERPIRVVAIHAGRQVATIGMADMPKATDGTIRLEPRMTVSVGFLLTDESIKTLNVQVLDGETDAVLYQSKDLPVRLGV